VNFLTHSTPTLGPIGSDSPSGRTGLNHGRCHACHYLRQPEIRCQLETQQSESPDAGQTNSACASSDRNEQLQKIAKFLEPENMEELSAKGRCYSGRRLWSRDAVAVLSLLRRCPWYCRLGDRPPFIVKLSGRWRKALSTINVIYTVRPTVAIVFPAPLVWVTGRVEERKRKSPWSPMRSTFWMAGIASRQGNRWTMLAPWFAAGIACILICVRRIRSSPKR